MKIVNIEADKLLKSQPSISKFMPKFTKKEVCISLCKRKGKKKKKIDSFTIIVFAWVYLVSGQFSHFTEKTKNSLFPLT